MGLPFLTARWSNLCLLTYAVPAALLRPRLPPGLELDLRGGQAFASLVAFDFLNTRVLAIPWPGYRNFAEINLRFYVRRGDERGVVFVREFVPQRLVAWLARVCYNDPYVAAPLRSTVCQAEDSITAEHHLTFAGRTHSLTVTGSKPPHCPGADSMEHFFKEHQWGYGSSRRGELIRYEVAHPVWDVYPVTSYHLDWDFERVYGPEWKVLQEARPCSVMLAVGSAIAVYPKAKPKVVAETASAVVFAPSGG